MRMRPAVAAWMMAMLGFVSALEGQTPAAANEHVLKGALVIENIGGGGRTLIQTDAVEALRVKGEWKTPQAGDEVKVGDAVRKWEERQAMEDGWLRLRGGGYALWTVESESEQVMILEAVGHGSVLVNGELRTGDPYEMGYVKLPVLLKAGANELLFKSGRGRIRAKLVEPKSEAMFNAGDVTLPDLLIGSNAAFGSIIVINATTDPMKERWISASLGKEPKDVLVPPLLPLSARKVMFSIPWKGIVDGDSKEQSLTLRLMKTDQTDSALDEVKINIGIRKPTEKHKRTFVSDIDGSVQYYSVVPPPEGTDLTEPKAVILSLHGASVEATNQAGCYKQRDWCYVICPTNRRPYGFDWEDWGRTDALEVLEQARGQFNLDNRRTYLTGHSMGGHGTWNIGVQFPGTFAALGPSAGWISFWSYAGGANRENVSEIEKILLRATCTSDTLAMKQNFAQQGIYILHGDADDNVPVGQARTMRKELAEFHRDFAYYEEPGAGHWWGDQCVDWDPMIEFFKRHVRPDEKDVTRIEFVTANPGVSGTCHWAKITQQVKPFELSRIEISVDREKKRFTAKTENVAGFHFQSSLFVPDNETYTVEVDGQILESVDQRNNSKADQGFGILTRDGDTWKAGGTRMFRSHLFKSAFSRNMVFVYGTKGTQEETAWGMAKARFDAEAFWYRGNGSVEVIADTDIHRLSKSGPVSPIGMNQEPPGMDTRNVILYGNADTNAAWDRVLGANAPIKLNRGSMTVGERKLSGEDLACVFLAPMKDQMFASVGVVGGTGLAGMRLTDRLPYFVSGVGIPDWVVVSPELFSKGAAGIKGAGFFGNDWSVENGEAVWQD